MPTTANIRTPGAIISPSPRERRVMYRHGNTADIIRVIMYGDRDSARFVRPESQRRLKGPDQYSTLENIFWFVKRHVNYRVDRPGYEIVRSPAYLFDTATGDCKSYSVAIGALCRAMGIPYRYRFVRQAGASNLHHVYILAYPTDGSARGPVVLDAALCARPNLEVAYRQHLDLRPGQRPPAGIGAAAGTGTDWAGMLATGAGIYLAYKILQRA